MFEDFFYLENAIFKPLSTQGATVDQNRKADFFYYFFAIFAFVGTPLPSMSLFKVC